MSDTFARVCEKFPTLSFSAQDKIAKFLDEEVGLLCAPVHWDDYRRLAVTHLNQFGPTKATIKTGIGKTTLYKWRRELTCLTRPTP